jgi:hypothetical protein
MTKKSIKQKHGSRTPWPIILAVVGVVLIAAAVLFANRGAGGTTGGNPKVAADPQKIDYGYVKFGNNESFDIKVTNTGTGTLEFKEKPYIEVLEGC